MRDVKEAARIVDNVIEDFRAHLSVTFGPWWRRSAILETMRARVATDGEVHAYVAGMLRGVMLYVDRAADPESFDHVLSVLEWDHGFGVEPVELAEEMSPRDLELVRAAPLGDRLALLLAIERRKQSNG